MLAWSLYDLANQSFTLLINTLLFAIYFKEVIVGDDVRGDALWSATYAVSMLVVVVVSPLLGALADCRGLRKLVLIATGIACAVLTACLAATGHGMVALAVAIYIPANIMYQIGENFLASFLPSISTSRTIGRISATGWAMGYVGALVLLVITATAMQVYGLGTPSSWRIFFVFAGIWFLLNMIPAMRGLHEPPVVRGEARGGFIATEALARLKDTALSAGRFRQLVVFLGAFFVYGMGVQVVVAFASIIARDFGFGTVKLVLFILQLTITAGGAAIATGFFQDRIGARLTVLIYLVVWMLGAGGLLTISLNQPCPEWPFWLAGNLIGIGLGGIGTASRSLVGRFTPGHKTAEFFGLWGMVYKLAGVVGVGSFGQVKAWIGMPASLMLLLGFFAAGFVLTLYVRETAGVRAAKRAERESAIIKRPDDQPTDS